MVDENIIKVQDSRIFNCAIELPLRKLITEAIKTYPSRTWVAQVTIFDDGDFQIELKNNYGEKTNSFEYSYSRGTYEQIVYTQNGDFRIIHSTTPLTFNSKGDRKE